MNANHPWRTQETASIKLWRARREGRKIRSRRRYREKIGAPLDAPKTTPWGLVDRRANP